MGVLDSDKPFHELTSVELAELDAHDWTAGQILRAIKMALEARDMEAVADLMVRLARTDPKAAAALAAVIEAAS